MKFFILMLLLVLNVSQFAWAGDLFAPANFESAGVMPKKIRSVRVLGFTTEIADKYNANGIPMGLAASMNKNVTWNDLAKAQKDYDRAIFEGYLNSKGTDLNQIVGESHGVINTRVTATVPVVAYGLNEKTTLALVIPVLYSNVNVDTGWTANENLEKGFQQFAADGKKNKILEKEPQLQNVIATSLSSKGYKPLENKEKSEIGDITLALKYQALKNDIVAVAVTPKVVLPTGRAADIDNLVDVPSGDGQWDLGLGTSAEVFLNSNLTAVVAAGYTMQLADHTAKRIPTPTGEVLSSDVDSSASRDLGDIATMSLAAKYRVAELYTLGAALGAQFKQEDHYKGGAFDSYRYDYLNVGTEQHMETAQVGVNFSTIPLFRAKKFPVPLETGVNFTQVLSGRNVKISNLAAFEMAMFF